MVNGAGPDDTHTPLSVRMMLMTTTAIVWVLAAITMWTHAAQLLGVPFKTYAYVCAAIAVAVLVGIGFFARNRSRAAGPTAIRNLILIILIGVIGSVLAVSMHRTGRISPDEYYYAANPVFYTQHPDASMSFESRLFYSKGAVESAGYYTAGAYEYAEAALAYLAGIRFATVYYILGAGLTGFLIPVATFLAVYGLSGSVLGSALGALLTLAAITTMGETSWAPGANAFVRAFEGKALLQFAGVPLLTAFSMVHWRRPRISSWLSLFALNAAMAGASTTSFALLPLLGALLFAAYWLTFAAAETARPRLVPRIASYAACFVYLGAWAIFVARHDGLEAASLLNADYSSSFGEYLASFVYAPFPWTPILVGSGCAAAILLAQGKSRSFLAWWWALAILLVLNPWTAQILLGYLRGIYYRLFYLLPFLLSVGAAAAFLFTRLSQRPSTYRWAAAAIICAASIILPVAIPVSVFRLPLYARGNTLYADDLARAVEITQVVPKGPMLAAYPLSGAVSMLDSDMPQMLTRPDLLAYYLPRAGSGEDAALRAQVQLYLDGNGGSAESIELLLQEHPEIRSLVMERHAYREDQAVLDRILTADGFSREPVSVMGTAVFIR